MCVVQSIKIGACDHCPSPSSAPFYKIMVPTVDTVRYDFLVYNLILAERPVLLVGPVGTGKTSVAQGVIQKLDSNEFSLLVINLSSQVGRKRYIVEGMRYGGR